jgi:predicted nucleic acid-binding protein
MNYVIDTSALIAALEGEAGSERVQSVMTTEHAIVPAIALLEMYYITWREQGQSLAEIRLDLLTKSGIEIAWSLDIDLLRIAASFKSAGRISLGDSIVAAVAVMNDAVLLHKDPEFAALQSKLRLEALPYK